MDAREARKLLDDLGFTPGVDSTRRMPPDLAQRVEAACEALNLAEHAEARDRAIAERVARDAAARPAPVKTPFGRKPASEE